MLDFLDLEFVGLDSWCWIPRFGFLISDSWFQALGSQFLELWSQLPVFSFCSSYCGVWRSVFSSASVHFSVFRFWLLVFRFHFTALSCRCSLQFPVFGFSSEFSAPTENFLALGAHVSVLRAWDLSLGMHRFQLLRLGKGPG